MSGFPFYLDFIPHAQAPKTKLLVHTHAVYEVMYFYNGNCRYYVDGDWEPIEPGHLFITDGVTRHGPMLFPGCHRTIVHFDSMVVRPLLDQAAGVDLLQPFRELRCRLWKLEGCLQREAEDILERMVRFHNRDGLSAFNRLRHAFHELLLFIYDIAEASLVNRSAANPDRECHVRRAVDCIERHYAQELSLDRIAAEAHISKYHLTRIFKQETGMTVAQYVRAFRVAQAKALLLANRGRSLATIGQEVGFQQPSHFSAIFRQETGLSPEQYRRSIEMALQ